MVTGVPCITASPTPSASTCSIRIDGHSVRMRFFQAARSLATAKEFASTTRDEIAAGM